MNQITKIAVTVAALLGLAACATDNVKPQVVVVNKPIPVPDVQPAPMTLKPVKWHVYNVAELKAIIAQMETNGQTGTIFYVLDQDQYSALTYDVAEMKRFIADQKSTNEYLMHAIQINNQGVAPPVATAPAEKPKQ